jgi:tripartite-type tricarboxylate transporter receptor subunit TctC
MKFPRRKFLHLAAGAAALPAVSHIARAQAYPTRPVRIIVGFPAGGANDVHARLFGQWLHERLGQPFIVENRPGGAGNVGTVEALRARPDGHTLIYLSTTNSINATFYERPGYDLINDIAPIGGFFQSGFVMLVNLSLPVRTVPEFIAYAKASPGKLNMGSAGVGNTGHLAGELLKMMAGIDMLHVPYRGEQAALSDLIGGQLHVQFATATSSIPLLKSGQVRALAVTSVKRFEALPDVPSLGEFVPGFEISTWSGLGAHKDTPRPIIEVLNREINAGLATPNIKARYADLSLTTLPVSPTEFRALIAEHVEKWRKIIRAANIKAS